MNRNELIEVKVPGHWKKCFCFPEILEQLKSPILQKYLQKDHQICTSDSRVYAGDSDNDFLRKRAFIEAQYSMNKDLVVGFNLVVIVQAEVCTSADPKEDEGFYDGCREVYRMPFIFDRKMLASTLWEIRKNPQLFRV